MIKAAKTVAIVGHIRPDGDCVGCCLALKMSLDAMGKTADIYIDGVVPRQFSFLEGFDKVKTEMTAAKYDLMITVDSSAEDRLGMFTKLREQCKKVLCIDHHIGTSIVADHTVAYPDSASCGEVLYSLFKANNIKITPQMATALYTAVSTDTGCFLYASTTAYTHRVAADLIELGVDLEKANYNNFRVYNKRVIAGIKYVLNNLRFVSGGRIGISHLKPGKYQYDHEERHKMQKYISDAHGVQVSIFITPDDNGGLHGSLRSHGNVNVAVVAQIFGGGGHKNAAGFTSNGKYKQVIKDVVRELEKALDAGGTTVL